MKEPIIENEGLAAGAVNSIGSSSSISGTGAIDMFDPLLGKRKTKTMSNQIKSPKPKALRSILKKEKGAH